MSITAIATKSGGPVLGSVFGKFAVEQFVFFLQKGLIYRPEPKKMLDLFQSTVYMYRVETN